MSVNRPSNIKDATSVYEQLTNSPPKNGKSSSSVPSQAKRSPSPLRKRSKSFNSTPEKVEKIQHALLSPQVQSNQARQRAGTFIPPKKLPGIFQKNPSGGNQTTKQLVDETKQLLKGVPSVTELHNSQKKDLKTSRSNSLNHNLQSEVKQKLTNSTAQCKLVLNELQQLSTIDAANDINECFAMANFKASLATELKSVMTKKLAEFQQMLCSLTSKSHIEYASCCKEQEKLLHEFQTKLNDFLKSMQLLSKCLNEKEVDLIVQKEKLVNEKTIFLNALKSFLQLNGQLLENKINTFKDIIHSDCEGVEQTFNALEIYFSSVKEFSKAYVQCFGYNSFSIAKNGVEYRVAIAGRHDETPSFRNAKDLLCIIPRELSQYRDLFTQLQETCKKTYEWRKDKVIPFDSEKKTYEGFSNLLALTNQMQEEINRMTALKG